MPDSAPVLCAIRRLHPLLDEEVDVFALDVLGWGFSQVQAHTGTTLTHRFKDQG